jgi:hypothetical protein
MSRTFRNRPDSLYCKEKLEKRDKKDPTKPPSWFKRIKRKMRRAKEKEALKHIEIEKVNLPIFKKEDKYDWF